MHSHGTQPTARRRRKPQAKRSTLGADGEEKPDPLAASREADAMKARSSAAPAEGRISPSAGDIARVTSALLRALRSLLVLLLVLRS